MVEVRLANPEDSVMIYSVDFHGATGPGGGAEFTQTDPADAKTVSFRALIPGIYVSVIGEIFDADLQGGSLTSPPITGVQTVTVPPGRRAHPVRHSSESWNPALSAVTRDASFRWHDGLRVFRVFGGGRSSKAGTAGPQAYFSPAAASARSLRSAILARSFARSAWASSRRFITS